MSHPSSLSMAELPPVFILPTHLQTEDLHEAEDALYHAGGRLSYRAPEARIFLTKVLHKKRVAFDLRACGLWTQEAPLSGVEPSSKRRKLDGTQVNHSRSHSGTASEDDDRGADREPERLSSPRGEFPDLSNHVVVLRLEWLDACIKGDTILPIESYLVYSAKIVEKPGHEKQPTPIDDGITYIKAVPESQAEVATSSQAHRTQASMTFERAKERVAEHPGSSQSGSFHRRKFGQKKTSPAFSSSPPTPKLYRASTSELEDVDASNLPPPPPWMSEPHPRPIYSCLRSTPPLEQSPNRCFIEQLGNIKEARLLTLDEIGVRAYSTSIASLAAYPHHITSPTEITRLPGCNDKIARLWVEWHESVTLSSHASETDTETNATTDNKTSSLQTDACLDPSRTIPIVNDLTNDQTLAHIRHFYQIWGVGPDTARRFHLTNGWTSLDDIVEFGWHTLNRSQQIGVKFFDEFQLTIPRTEVESIARTVLHHARLARNIPKQHWTNDVTPDRSSASNPNLGDPRDFVAVIVGGHRRGKPASGDVDVILSHRDAHLTHDLVVDVVASLETAGFITHTLTLHTATSDRDQQTLPFRADGPARHSFDSLDKALCVWQDPTPGKNPNVHRRVDIIVSAWRTVGCAVLGWSGGTTFQRDVRRWVKREKGWKFDSSGVRDRGSGAVLDLEGPIGKDDGDGWEDRERRLMTRMGIGWRPAVERCTG